MKKIILLFFSLSAMILSGANLLDNADFKTLFNGKPVDWGTNLPKNFLTVLPGEGVNNTNAVKVDFSRYDSFGQGGLKLVPGERYRISAYVKTRNFSCIRGGIVVPNYSWRGEAGINKIPADTGGKWQKLEMEITCIAPAYNKSARLFGSEVYSFAIFAIGGKGEFMLSSPSLVPVSERAQKESCRLYPYRKVRRIVLLEPLFSQIPDRNGKLEFFWSHDAEAAIRVVIQTPRKSITVKGELKNHRASVILPDLPQGKHQMRVVLNGNAGKNGQIHEELDVITVVPAKNPPEAKRLNNLVKVIFDGRSSGEFAFENDKCNL